MNNLLIWDNHGISARVPFAGCFHKNGFFLLSRVESAHFYVFSGYSSFIPRGTFA